MHLMAPAKTDKRIALVCIALAVAALGYGVAAVALGTADTTAALVSIGPLVFAAGTGVVVLSWGVRFFRWQWLLASLGHRLAPLFSLRVYLAGMALSSTPGKLGETFRSALLLPRGVPVNRSLAAFGADRLSDVIGVATLGAVAAWLNRDRLGLLELMAAGLILGSVGLAYALRSRAAQVALFADPEVAASGWKRRLVGLAGMLALDWARVWSLRTCVCWASLAVLAYGLQALVFAEYVARVWPGLDRDVCVAIFASSILIGAASMLPGGLGAMDSALALQLGALGVPWPQALAAVLAVRASTLWFAWLVGLVALLSFARAALPVPLPLASPASPASPVSPAPPSPP
jgi:uncharacterized membrane protein YbhN (UPF0104 family)